MRETEGRVRVGLGFEEKGGLYARGERGKTEKNGNMEKRKDM